MIRFLLRRIRDLAVSLFVVITLVFFLFRLMPGDPTSADVDGGFSIEARQMVIERFGLDQPVHVQYVRYMRNLAQGDFGRSFFYRRPANEVVGEKIVNTLVLMLPAVTMAYLLGVVGGTILTWKRGTRFETATIIIALFFRAAPVFFTGLLLLMLFAYQLGWLPHSGMRSPGYPETSLLLKFLSLDFLRHFALPFTVATLYLLATPLLIMRNTLLETVGEDYIDYCRVRGMSERRVLFRHAFRNALLPVVTSAALSIGTAIGGFVVLEYIFGWPGLGREIILAAQRSDYPVAQFGLLLLAATVMLMNLFADLLYGQLDPRVRTT
jgi:peptide/nickel transport system permease protein